MGWRTRILAELTAGGPAALLGADFPEPAQRERLLENGMVSPGPLPEPGEELLLPTPHGPRWCQVVPCESDGGLYHAYPHRSHPSHELHPSHPGPPCAVLSFPAPDLQILEFDRPQLYRLLAEEIGCRPGVEEAASGLWIVGTAALPQGGRARVYLLEPGLAPEALEAALRRCAYKTVCLLTVSHGSQFRVDHLGSLTGKALLKSSVEENAFGKFAASALEELQALEAEPRRGAWIDRASEPPLLVVGEEKFKLTMFGRQPAFGVLLLEYLFEHPREPISCWDLERKVCASKETLQKRAGSTDELLDAKAERDLRRALKEKSAELAELENDPTTSEFERETIRAELETLRQHYLQTHSGHGRKRLLGNTDTQRVRHRVRKALGAQIQAVREQSPQIATILETTLGKGNLVQFLPPPEWAL